MKTYRVSRMYVSPPRQGDDPDYVEITAESPEVACAHAFHQLRVNGTYTAIEID